jgi:hypothetical protein
MMESWAIAGRICLDPAMHERLFHAAQAGRYFNDLDELRRILRVELRMNVSRWEVMLIHRFLTERNLDITLNPMPIASPEEDREITAIRANWAGPTPWFPDDYHLCAAIGLACMDVVFRVDLFNASDPGEPGDVRRLDRFLRNPGKESPVFSLNQQHLLWLNDFLRREGTIRNLEAFHMTRWVQPQDFACDGGYSKMEAAPFFVVPQGTLVRVLQQRPEVATVLRECGAAV